MEVVATMYNILCACVPYVSILVQYSNRSTQLQCLNFGALRKCIWNSSCSVETEGQIDRQTCNPYVKGRRYFCHAKSPSLSRNFLLLTRTEVPLYKHWSLSWTTHFQSSSRLFCLHFQTKINTLCAMYCSPSIVRVIKSIRMIWAGHVARMGESRGVYRLLVGKNWAKETT